MASLRGTVAAAVDLVLPQSCAGCDAGGALLCPECWRALPDAPDWFAPTPPPAGLPPVAGAGRYGGRLRRLVIAYKERGQVALVRPLGALLAGAVGLARSAGPGYGGDPSGGAGSAFGAAAPAPGAGPAREAGPALGTGPACEAVPGLGAGSPYGDRLSGGAAPGRGPVAAALLLVPVPTTTRSRRERGDDHVLRLARTAAALLRAGGLPARVAPVLQVVRRVRDQASLDAADRAANLAGAFAPARGADRVLRRLTADAPGPVPTRPPEVIVIDDILTTGATLAEASRALSSCGFRPAAAAVIAASSLRETAVYLPKRGP